MALIRYNPNRWFEGDFDRVFSGLLPSVLSEAPAEARAFVPRVDIRDGEHAIELTAEIPGVDKDTLKVEVLERALTLSGEKQSEKEENENGVYRSERVYGSFERRFTLPETVDVEGIVATFENGVLKVRFPKKPEAKPRQIAVEGEKGGKKKIAVA